MRHGLIDQSHHHYTVTQKQRVVQKGDEQLTFEARSDKDRARMKKTERGGTMAPLCTIPKHDRLHSLQNRGRLLSSKIFHSTDRWASLGG